jgi:hypothetical protein
MKKALKIFLPILIITLFLAGCSDENFQSKTASGNLSIVGSTTHDWGNINIKGGDAEHTFAMKNSGDSLLYLKGAETSCMCTTARYRLPGGSMSPKFGMHNNTTTWGAEIKPGETFELEAVFDPMAHGPNATGPISRSVFLMTSDPNMPKQELKVKGNVLSEDDYNAEHPL